MIYIDDGLITAEEDNDIKMLLDRQQREFEINIVDAHVFLGLEIHQLADHSIHINQAAYAAKVLATFNMSDAVPVSTRIDSSSSSSEGVQVAGSSVGTRPDIAFAVNSASRHLENPSPMNVSAVKRILKYIKVSADLGIYFESQNDINLYVFSDADYAGD